MNKTLCLLLALCACGRTDPEGYMRVLSAAGEFPSMNELTAPQGAALTAVNVVVDNQDEYTTHRGIQRSPVGPREWTSMTVWQGAIIANSSTEGALARLVGGVWTEYADFDWYPPTGERMAFVESNGSLFFTTYKGLYRLDSLTGEPVLSGLPQGLPGTATLSGSSGFLTEGYTVAYRHSWAINVDANGDERLVEGAPSPRLLVNNPTATAATRNVDVSWPIPDDLPVGAYNRTFRSDAVIETISPTDEVRQVYEREPTEAERTAGVFTFTDSTPDVVKGPGAYFSANTGEGIAQSNYRAALLHGLTKFNDSLFGITVDGVQRVSVSMLGALAVGQGLELTRGVVSESYIAGIVEIFPNVFQTFAGVSTPALDLAQTVESLCRAINSRPNGLAYAFPLDTDGTQPGLMLIQSRTLDQTPITLGSIGDANSWAPAIQATNFGTFARPALSSTVTVTMAYPHGFVVDQFVDVISVTFTTGSGITVGQKTVSAVPSATTFEFIEAGPAATGDMVVSDIEAPVTTSSGTASNAYAWAKQGEPDHWPLTNIGTVGNAADTLWWGAPLDRFLFLGSTSGLYRLQGNAREGFTLMDNGVWDSTTSFLGRRTVAVLDGRAFAIAKEGLVEWTEGMKPESADTPIQDEIRALVAAIPDVVAEYGFLFADDTNHRLYVCLPQQSTDTAATVCHILSTRTGAWTRLDSTFPGFEEGWVWGMAPPESSGTLYALKPLTSDERFNVFSSRNTYTNADYQGPNGEGIPAKVTYLPLIAGEPERFKQWTWTRVFTKAPTTKLTVCFASEWQPTEECQLLPDIDPVYTGYEPISDPVRGIAWRTIVDKFRQRAKSLTVAIGHSQAQEPLHLLGLEVKHRPYGAGQ